MQDMVYHVEGESEEEMSLIPVVVMVSGEVFPVVAVELKELLGRKMVVIELMDQAPPREVLEQMLLEEEESQPKK